MKIKPGFVKLILAILPFITLSCGDKYYTEADFKKVLKVDSHFHIDSDKGISEKQAAEDNMVLITINVDHARAEDIQQQLDLALNSVKKYPGRVFYEPTFWFDTTAWGTNQWRPPKKPWLPQNQPRLTSPLWGLTEGFRTCR